MPDPARELSTMVMRSSRPQTRLLLQAGRSPEQLLLSRLGLLLALMTLILLIFWFDRAGLKDQIDNDVSFSDVVYFTAVTVTTVGYGDIVPVSDRARILDALLVTPLRLIIWFIFLGTAYELVLQRWLEAWRMNRLKNTLSDHIIICGFGLRGQNAAREAVARGEPAERILVLDRDDGAVVAAAAAGYIGLRGDSTREHDLADAGLARAKALLVCLGHDDTSVLTVLTVRQLNAGVRVVCSVDEEENIKLIRHAGADAIVAPSMVGGYLMADSIHSSHISEYIDDLMRMDGHVRMHERVVHEDEIGRPMRDLSPGIAVSLHRRGERIDFWEGDRAIVQRSDVVLFIEPNHVAAAPVSPLD
jgi:voltage-gated potassium channel